MNFKRALVTVSDKTGLVEFLKPLVDQGLQIVSTGGTAEFLKSHNLEVTLASEQTGFPEVFSGRVKTLHPHIFMPLLARSWKKEDQKVLKEYNLQSFDLVICNLYPFENHKDTQKDEELVEWIDVGGPSLLRAAAKNFFTITTLCCPQDYKGVTQGTTLEQRKALAAKVFKHLCQYDQNISERLEGDQVQDFSLKTRFIQNLRYGENPHQKAKWYQKPNKKGLHEAQVLQGSALSFNNILDFSAALSTLKEFNQPCCVAIKHNNPCGVACGEDVFLSVSQALEADPVSVFGGVLATNQPLDKKTAERLTQLFLEGIIAPDYSAEALEMLKVKPKLRVLKWPEINSFQKDDLAFKEVLGGVLVQTQDQVCQEWSDHWEIIGKAPSEQIKKDLLFAWKVCAHLTSNAIALVKDQQTVGLGMGQVNRVDAVKSSLERAHQFHPNKTSFVLASDAFFPFADSIELAHKQGVSWIIQPGGSVKDKEIIKKSQDLGLNMVITGQRHFKH